MALSLKVVDGPNAHMLEHGLLDFKQPLVEITVEYAYKGIRYRIKLGIELIDLGRGYKRFSGTIKSRVAHNVIMPPWVDYNTQCGTMVTIIFYDVIERKGEIDDLREVW